MSTVPALILRTYQGDVEHDEGAIVHGARTDSVRCDRSSLEATLRKWAGLAATMGGIFYGSFWVGSVLSQDFRPARPRRHLPVPGRRLVPSEGEEAARWWTTDSGTSGT
jgi:hypothetical protein